MKAFRISISLKSADLAGRRRPRIARVYFERSGYRTVGGLWRPNPRGGGELTIEAWAGDVVAVCLELRSRSVPDPCRYHLVLADGALGEPMTRDQARRAWLTTWGEEELR